jgi:CopG family nickel-responsive transcriptional regulator
MPGEDDDITRIGISLPEKLLGEFDEILACRGYLSRSEGIRDAIRTYNLVYQWLCNGDTPRQGVFTMVYNFWDGPLLAELASIRHRHQGVISTSVQTYIDRHRRVEILLVQGSSRELQDLVEILRAEKGIEAVKITTTRADPEP